MHFDQLTIQDKLSHNTVRCLLQDQYGYIWIGTQNGLNKYDGYSFETFRTDRKTGFVGKSITALFEDRLGNIWVGTAREGINLLPTSRGEFINLRNDSAFLSIDGYGISAIHEDSRGNIWITTVGGGVLRYQPETSTSVTYTSQNSGLSNDLVFDLAEDKYGGIWIASAGLGINYLEPTNTFSQKPEWSRTHENLAGYRKTLLMDGEYLWIGTEGTGLYRLSIDDGEIIQYSKSAPGRNNLSSNGIIDLHMDRNNQLFIATDGGGLNILDKESGTIRRYQNKTNVPSSLNSNALLCFLEDRSHNIWIGTYNGGINIYKPGKTRFRFLSPNQRQGQRFDNWSVLTISQLRNGTILVGTDGEGLFEIQQLPSTREFRLVRNKFHSILTGNVIKAIHEDRSGKIWIGMFSQGLTCINPETGEAASYRHDFWNPGSLSGDNVWSITEDQDGGIWLGTLGGGISVWDPETRQFSRYLPDENDPSSLSDANIMVVYADRSGRVWVGTMDKGLDVWMGQGKGFRHFRHNPSDSLSISNDEIRAIYEDHQGNIWIGTEGGGLNRWKDDGTFERYGSPQGLSGSSVAAITQDANRNLWLASYHAVTCLDPISGRGRNYSFQDEQNVNQFNQMASITATDGRLLLGGIKGIHHIHLSEIQENNIPPSIMLTRFTLFNRDITAGPQEDGRTHLDQSIEVASKIMLDYADNSFSISLATTDFDKPEENQFLYRMEGFDREWRATEEGQHQASYTNLEPGSYTFRLKYKNSEKSIKVEIKPPFWQRLWFRISVVFLALTMTFGGVYFIISRREAVFRRQALEAKSEILRLQNEKLASEVEAANSKLVYSSAQMAHKNSVLTQVKKDIQEKAKQQGLDSRQIIRLLNRELEGENYWTEFNLYFNEVDKEFTQTLSARHPELTSNDLRLCALIRLNLTTKEIASLLNISVRGVEQGRYRLKKRLNLEADQNLLRYIAEV